MPRPRRRPGFRKPHLTIAQILNWVDDFRRRRGDWPHVRSGRITYLGETWHAVDAALRDGRRGLPGGSSLAKLLFAQRGVRNPGDLPPLDKQQIIRWAQRHFERTGKWPTPCSSSKRAAPGETWSGIDLALRRGTRGLPGSSSLSDLLAAAGLQHNRLNRPSLVPAKILAWADAHHQRTGVWPATNSGRVADSPLETWRGIDRALRYGQRQLPGGSTLSIFLNQHRHLFAGKSRRPKPIPVSKRLTIDQVAGWCVAHFRRTGAWPTRHSGAIGGARRPRMKWNAVDQALRRGSRGLPEGGSLIQLVRRLTAQNESANGSVENSSPKGE